MTKKNYPEEIYNFPNTSERATERSEAIGSYNAEQMARNAYDMGEEKASDRIAGYSNLTEPITRGENIDWDRLKGKEVLVTHKKGWRIEGFHLAVNDDSRPFTDPSHWDLYPLVNEEYFINAWYGWTGWTLYVKGEVPLKRQTADTLPLGTCFKGSYDGSVIKLAQHIANEYGDNLVTDMEVKNIGGYSANEVEVIEVYGVGTFKKESE